MFKRLRAWGESGEAEIQATVLFSHALFVAFLTDAYVASRNLWEGKEWYHVVLPLLASAGIFFFYQHEFKKISKALWYYARPMRKIQKKILDNRAVILIPVVEDGEIVGHRTFTVEKAGAVSYLRGMGIDL